MDNYAVLSQGTWHVYSFNRQRRYYRGNHVDWNEIFFNNK